MKKSPIFDENFNFLAKIMCYPLYKNPNLQQYKTSYEKILIVLAKIVV